MNLYGFVGNNPLTKIDNDGRMVLQACAVVAAVGFGVGYGIGSVVFKDEPKDMPLYEQYSAMIQAGRVPKCWQVIYLGHNRSLSPHIPDLIKTGSDSYASVCTCFASDYFITNPIPDIVPRPSGTTTISLYTAAALAVDDFGKAVKNTIKVCRNSSCCTVHVYVDCSGLTSAEKSSIKHYNICDRYFKYGCPGR